MAKEKHPQKGKAQSTASKQRDIQAQQDQKDASKAEKKAAKKASQSGAREHPEPPMPAQHLQKPGLEKDMELKPQFRAPNYKGSGKLEGFSTIVTGGDSMSLASNLVKQGIRVNAVAPGPIWTPLNPADQPAEKIESFGKNTAMGRPGQPEELSPAYVFLASPCCSSYVTGIVLPVTGSPG